MKCCSTCKQERPDDEFRVSKSQCRLCRNAKIYAWRKANPDAVRQIKRRYYSTDKGKACKAREEAAFVASGRRAVSEAKRAMQPLSEARRDARVRWARRNQAYFTADRAKRRALERVLHPDDFWVLQEAVRLCRLRERMLGGAWHVDHIVPVSKGGTSEPHNLQVVPATWNRRKSNRSAERFFGAAA